MTTRVIKANAGVEPCPKCGNKTTFTIKSDYCAEDCCEVWAVCKCGHEGERFEDVWGGVGNDNCYAAMACWNEGVERSQNEPKASKEAEPKTKTT